MITPTTKTSVPREPRIKQGHRDTGTRDTGNKGYRDPELIGEGTLDGCSSDLVRAVGGSAGNQDELLDGREGVDYGDAGGRGEGEGAGGDGDVRLLGR